MAGPHQIVTVADVRAFFRDRVAEVLARRGLALDLHTEFYLVNLLAEYARAEQLYERDEAGGRDEPVAAFLLARAVSAPPDRRLRLLRRLGDVSLYLSGFFPDRLKRRLVDVDYYIAMGGRAYEGAAALSGTVRDPASRAAVYGELAERFAELVDCLTELSEELRVTRTDDPARDWERWLLTGSERLARRLLDAGIVPSRGAGKWVH